MKERFPMLRDTAKKNSKKNSEPVMKALSRVFFIYFAKVQDYDYYEVLQKQ